MRVARVTRPDAALPNGESARRSPAARRSERRAGRALPPARLTRAPRRGHDDDGGRRLARLTHLVPIVDAAPPRPVGPFDLAAAGPVAAALHPGRDLAAPQVVD